MGSQQSSPEPTPPRLFTYMTPAPTPPPPSPTFREPWRKVPWGDREQVLQYMKDYQPQNDEVKHIRVLLYGPVGVGKSSFISSVSSVLRERMTVTALANANNDDKSFTKKYKTYKIRKEGRGDFYPIVFNDIMGLEEGSERGVSVEDLKLILRGHVKDGYKFNPIGPLSRDDLYYNPSPSPDDKVHVLVWVGSANTSSVTKTVLEKMKDVREAASELGIPQLALATKVDEACAETEKDLKNVYKSKYMKKKMTEFSNTLGIPLNCILPMKNYSEEIEVNNDIDCLILSALKLMVDFGDDFIDPM